MTELAAAFMLGLAGSSHCLVMCGPLTIVVRSGLTRNGWGFGALYHAARVSSYATLGVGGGLVGRAFAAGGAGRIASIAAGLVLIVVAALQMGSRGLPAMPGIGRRVAQAIARVHRHRQAHPTATALAAGALNALLPCGLVYMALIGAVGVGGVARGAAFMLMFGAGTVPALAVVWSSAGAISPTWRRRLGYAAPVAVAAVGVLLIIRGADAPVTLMAHMAGHMHGN